MIELVVSHPTIEILLEGWVEQNHVQILPHILSIFLNCEDALLLRFISILFFKELFIDDCKVNRVGSLGIDSLLDVVEDVENTVIFSHFFTVCGEQFLLFLDECLQVFGSCVCDLIEKVSEEFFLL